MAISPAADPQNPSVGAYIRAARRALGWTQDDLAKAVGVSRSAVAQWETDRAGQVRANLTRIAKVLQVPVTDLLGTDLLGGAPPVRDTESRSADELALLRLYRECNPDDRGFLLRTARKLARLAE
jgi:transcriptional regulator with XRE-family HTH domain